MIIHAYTGYSPLECLLAVVYRGLRKAVGMRFVQLIYGHALGNKEQITVQ
jgi:hypothetical protein